MKPATMRAMDKEVRKALRRAEDEGWDVAISRSNHLHITHPDYGLVVAALTPSSDGTFAVKQLLGDMRRAKRQWLEEQDRLQAEVEAAEEAAREQFGDDYLDYAPNEYNPLFGCPKCKGKAFVTGEALSAHVRKEHPVVTEPEPEPVQTPTEEVDMDTIQDTVEDAMKTLATEDPVRPKDVADLTDLDPKQVSNALIRLVDRGDVRKEGRGAYLYIANGGADKTKTTPKMKAEEKKPMETQTVEMQDMPPAETEDDTHTPENLIFVIRGEDGRSVYRDEHGHVFIARLEMV